MLVWLAVFIKHWNINVWVLVQDTRYGCIVSFLTMWLSMRVEALQQPFCQIQQKEVTAKTSFWFLADLIIIVLGINSGFVHAPPESWNQYLIVVVSAWLGWNAVFRCFCYCKNIEIPQMIEEERKNCFNFENM